MHALSETRVSRGVVSSGGQTGAFTGSAHAAKRVRAHKKGLQQAPLVLESGGEHCKPILEEGTLGGAANIATPSIDVFSSDMGGSRCYCVHGQGGAEPSVDNEIVVISEEEGENGEVSGGMGRGTNNLAAAGSGVQGTSLFQWVPRVISPMVHRVQEWEVANQSVSRAGEQVEFVDKQGSVLRGTICGVTREDGSAGYAQVRLFFWQQDQRPAWV
ncbi:hypothetical protein NDU88_001574 [Pleurodeles waltl]|uniref:Uncharacterized protein n=1 Tax=Pleurodeles waltl TaxID=8319 RepID=A0AAV7WP09_PLEWA|nr:hypothetical protein NDU88_001574 [Pleurodeles waltl]